MKYFCIALGSLTQIPIREHCLIFDARLLFCVLLTAIGAQAASPPGPSGIVEPGSVVRQELLDRLKHYPRLCLPQQPTDIRAVIQTSHVFGDETIPVETMKIRYLFELENNAFFAAYRIAPESKVEIVDATLVAGAFRFGDGSFGMIRLGEARWNQTPAETPLSAMISNHAPFPFFQTVLAFPSFSSVSDAFRSIYEVVSSDTNDVSVRLQDGAVTYTVKIIHEPTRFDLWRWTFDTQSGLLLERNVDRAIDSQLRSYLQTHLQWSVSLGGQPQLDSMLTFQPVIRMREGFHNGKQFGEEQQTVNFTYKSFDPADRKPYQQEGTGDSRQILQFLSEAD